MPVPIRFFGTNALRLVPPSSSTSCESILVGLSCSPWSQGLPSFSFAGHTSQDAPFNRSGKACWLDHFSQEVVPRKRFADLSRAHRVFPGSPSESTQRYVRIRKVVLPGFFAYRPLCTSTLIEAVIASGQVSLQLHSSGCTVG